MRSSRGGTQDVGVWQVASLLLTYPDEALIERLDLMEAVVADLPAPAAGPLADVLEHVRSTPLGEQQRTYVTTFDLRKKCCLYLSWWVQGDTRNRGYALVEFKATYRDAGVTPPSDELPDHLAVVLEFAARVAPAAGRDLLTGHRAALELLRKALHGGGSPYAGVLDAVCSTLPPPGPETVATARRIAAVGPPTEMVGLEPFSGAAR